MSRKTINILLAISMVGSCVALALALVSICSAQIIHIEIDGGIAEDPVFTNYYTPWLPVNEPKIRVVMGAFQSFTVITINGDDHGDYEQDLSVLWGGYTSQWVGQNKALSWGCGQFLPVVFQQGPAPEIPGRPGKGTP